MSNDQLNFLFCWIIRAFNENNWLHDFHPCSNDTSSNMTFCHWPYYTIWICIRYDISKNQIKHHSILINFSFFLRPSVLSGRVSHSSSGDRRVPCLRKSSTVWIWQHDRRTDDYKIILNCVRKTMKNKNEKKRQGKAQTFFKVWL